MMAALAATPGPAILFAVSAGISRGRQGALFATAGMISAAIVWFIASAFGLMVIAAAVPWIFRAAGWIGVAYIAWLGLSAILGACRPEAPAPRSMREPGRSVFVDGFIVQATNPKALLFFTAILPPFVDMTRPIGSQLAAFAVGMMSIDSFFMISYGMLGAAFAYKMREARFRRIFGLLVGATLMLVAGLMLRRL